MAVCLEQWTQRQKHKNIPNQIVHPNGCALCDADWRNNNSDRNISFLFGRFCRNFSVKRFVSSCHFSSNRIWENRRVLQKYLSIGLRLKMDYYVSNVILSKLKTRSANVKKMLNWTKPFFRQSSLFECFISVSLKIHLIWVCAWVPNFAGIYSPKKK